MASTYTTIQGDTWDLIAYKLYGEEKYMKNLIEANWPLLDQRHGTRYGTADNW